MNLKEVKIFIKVIIYMNCTSLKQTVKYWESDSKKSEIYTSTLYMIKLWYY